LNVSRLPVTFGLIAACVFVYFGVAAVAASVGISFGISLLNQPPEVLILGALVPEFVAQGEAWRLVTSTFLHSGSRTWR
jgi:membrane associated rhomboid family serine protease